MSKEGGSDIPHLPDVYHADDNTVQKVATGNTSEPAKRRSPRMTNQGRPEATDTRHSSVPKWVLDQAVQDADGDRSRIAIDPRDGLPVILNNPRVPPEKRRYGQDIWQNSSPEPEPLRTPSVLARAALALAGGDDNRLKYPNGHTILIENYPGQSEEW